VAGYSGKPLVAKLGIKAGSTIAILEAPRGYARTLGKIPSVTRRSAAIGRLDFIQFFTKQKRDLERRFPALERALAPAGMLWISWPKQASGVATDLTEDVIRAIGLAHGLVDVKVAAVAEVWSGLKFVRRVKDR
jgi:alkylation response protein AidB-like acyl-CoA dehydrogenase